MIDGRKSNLVAQDGIFPSSDMRVSEFATRSLAHRSGKNHPYEWDGLQGLQPVCHPSLMGGF